MRFVLYSEKTVAQCLTAINARMQVKGTSTRPALDGWVEKGGGFSISVTAPVIGKFSRRTALTAKVEREGGITMIRGSVASGVAREGQAFVFVALALVALAIIGSGNVLVGLLLVPFAAYLYIPLHGDYLNSAVLLDEVEKTLKAKSKPPKKATAESKTVKSAAAPARAKSAKLAAKRPAARSRAIPKPSAPSPVSETVPANAALPASAPLDSPALPVSKAAPATKAPPTTKTPPARKAAPVSKTPSAKAARSAAPSSVGDAAPPESEFPTLPGEAPP